MDDKELVAMDRALERCKNADDEISRLATENWKLRERLKKSEEFCLKLQKRLRDRPGYQGLNMTETWKTLKEWI